MVCGAEAVLEAAMSSVVRESAIVFMLGWGVFVLFVLFVYFLVYCSKLFWISGSGEKNFGILALLSCFLSCFFGGIENVLKK